MAVGQNLLFGRMKQKIGGIVTSTWKGINVIKSKPLTVANPKTDPQLMRRSALIQIMAIARSITGAIQNGFREQAVYKSAFNAFVGYCLRNAFNYAAPPTATLVPADVKISQGTISPTSITVLTALAAADTIDFTFNNGLTGPGQSLNDKAYAVAYNSTTNEWCFCITDGNERGDGATTQQCPVGFINVADVVYGYLFFYNSTLRKSSDSDNANDVAA